MLDTKAIAAGLLKTVQEWLVPTFRAIDERLLDLDQAVKAIPAGPKGDPGEKGEPGLNGKDGEPGEKGLTGDRGERGEPGQRGEKGDPGERGLDGKDGVPGERGETGAKGDPGERGEPGQKGDPGERGEKGDPGERGLDGKDGAAGERGEPGQKGDPGERGEPGLKGERGEKGDKGDKGESGEIGPAGKDGADGARGADGKSITPEDMLPILEGVVTRWALDFERRAADVLQRAAERIPVPKDGVDGLGFDDMTEEVSDDGRTVIRRYVRGDQVKEFRHRFACVLDRGVFRETHAYERGDGVTWAGSFFIAQKDNPVGKPGESDDWRLAVKRGRDGKDADAPPAPRGPVRLK